MAGGRTTLDRPERAGSRGGSRAAGDRRPRPLPPPAGALGGVPSRVAGRTTACARRAGGGERSRARRRPPRLAPRTRRRRTGRSRGRRARALRRTRAEPRRPRGRSGAPRAGDRADRPTRRSRPARALAAAEASFQAGEFEAAQRLLATAESGPLDGFQRARAGSCGPRRRRRPRYGNEAAPLLLEAAKRLEPFDLSLARRAYLTAWSAAVTAHHLGGADVLHEICRAVRALPRCPRTRIRSTW